MKIDKTKELEEKKKRLAFLRNVNSKLANK